MNENEPSRRGLRQAGLRRGVPRWGAAGRHGMRYTVLLLLSVMFAALLVPFSGAGAQAAATCPCSLWNAATTPGTVDSGDGAAVEVGLAFSSDTNGYLDGLRFYKSAANTGVHVGSLWTPTGTLLAQVTFSGETASGWQQASFAAPVPVTAGTSYVVSYHSNTGHYSFDGGYFNAPLDLAPLHVPASTSAAPNGLFAYSTVPTFPANGSNGSNYWVDPVFDTAAPSSEPTPAVLSTSPAAGASATGVRPTLTAVFNVPVQPASVSFALVGPGGPVAGTTGYNVATQTASFTPTGLLSYGASYQATLAGAQDLYGHPMSGPVQWSFTLTPPSCPCALWSTSTTPGTVDSGDAASVEVGTAFTSDVAGTVTGVQFYKSAANVGIHVGSLWTATGTLLGQVTFAGESASGWQQATFTPPVTITGGTTYVISYYAPNGHYSADHGYFATGYDAAPLHAPGGPGTSNGLFTYSPTPIFPTGTFNATNYWVSPVFAPTRTLQSITVAPNPVSVPAGLSVQLTATGHYSDTTTQDLTSTATWTATPGATVSATGLLTGGSTGTGTATATLGSVTGSTAVTVTAPVLQSITVTPNPVSVPAGLTVQLTATGHYSDASTANLTAASTWTAGPGATVSPTGLLTGGTIGTRTATATLGSITGSTAVTVTAPVLQTITVTPNPVSVAAGLTVQLTATGHYSDASTANLTAASTWTAGPGATVSPTGLLTGGTIGTRTATATLGSITGSTAVTVTAPVLQTITVTPATAQVIVAIPTALSATGHYSDGSSRDLTSSVTWTSTNTSVSTVSAAGVVTNRTAGAVTIIASTGGLSATANLTSRSVVQLRVAPLLVTTSVRTPVQLTATALLSDGTTATVTPSVTWSSGFSLVATVSSTGLVTPRSPGLVTVSASLGSLGSPGSFGSPGSPGSVGSPGFAAAFATIVILL